MKSNEDWMNALPKRKVSEVEFHDRLRGSEAANKELNANKKFYSTTGKSHRYVGDWIRQHSPGKVFLDYACGTGQYAVQAANAGASLAIGIDISPVAVDLAQERAIKAGVGERAVFVQGDCEHTGLPDNSVDVVICSGMLHHLDLSYAFPELRRIMKPGGVCLAVEALNYNPVIKLYRWATPRLRTDWEKRHILSLADLAFAKRFFNVRDVRYWHFCTIACTPLRNSSMMGPALRVAEAVDEVLLRIFPLSLMAWMFSFVLEKRPAEE